MKNNKKEVKNHQRKLKMKRNICLKIKDRRSLEVRRQPKVGLNKLQSNFHLKNFKLQILFKITYVQITLQDDFAEK